MTDSISGKLLIASPALPDWFRRAVILIVEHSDEGAFGLVLNRTSESSVAEAAPELAKLAGGDELIRIGGPVAPQGVVALAEFDDPAEAQRGVLDNLGLVDLERSDQAVGRIRLYAGHAGWGPGQLDDELEQEAWIVEDADAGDPFREEDLWPLALRRKGDEYALLARMPADPSMN